MKRSSGATGTKSTGSRPVVYAALAGNFLVAATKFAAAWWTGSSAMLSEAIHSLVDMTNGGLVLHGIRRAELPPDREHPLGYGRELYFWSFVVSLLIFTGGAGISVYEGILRTLEPSPLIDVEVNFVVLSLAFVFEFATWWVAFRAFRDVKGDIGYFEAVKRSKDPTTFLVLFEDSAAIIGIAIAFAGTFAADRLQWPALDGLASIGIGVVLGASALVVARESKGLLIGEPARAAINASLLQIARQLPNVENVHGLTTVHLAPTQIVATFSVEFADHLRTPDIEAAVLNIEKNIKAAHPEVIQIFVKPQTFVPSAPRPT